MPEMTADRLLPSSCHALGPHWDGRGTHFAVFSEHAERIELCLFDSSGRHETRLPLPDCTDGVWRGYLPGASPGALYGYRAYGPYEPSRGLRFNGHKLLLDPYARRLQGKLRWHDALYGYRVGHDRADLSFDRRNSAEYLPKAVVADDRYDWKGDYPPRVPWSDTVIYELHVKGWSRLNERVPPGERGTFGALGHPASIDYLRRLGVTAVELLPVQAFARDRILLERRLTNYWGYNTLGYFAPDAAYLSDGSPGQLKWAVQRLHAAGIEVILDVVYNHTCEGNELGPTLSWRGFDNGSYYRLTADDPRRYVDDTGCGNTVNMSHPRVIQMVMDSLRWWAAEYRVDGFRFDLGTTLGREAHGFNPGCGFFDALLQDPVLGGLKLISEPWDLGPGGYQVGRHPPGFAEWNDKFRSCVRRYWKGDAGMRGALAAVLQGTAELFDHRRRRPWASVNFITAHDGFTLRDLVSYEAKHNEDNGEDNRDGSDYNDSRNWGAEGPTEDGDIESRRRRVQRSLLCTLFLSHGTPMLLAGDELGRSQQGNNNAYCQDNALSWLDWRLVDTDDGRALFDFIAQLIRIRREYRVFQGPCFQHGRIEPAPGMKDIFWFDERGNELAPADWDNHNARLLGVRRALDRGDGRLEVAILLFNADEAAHDFQLPPPALDYRLIAGSENDAPPDAASGDRSIHLPPQGTAVLLALPETGQLRQQLGTSPAPQNDAAPDDGVIGTAA